MFSIKLLPTEIAGYWPDEVSPPDLPALRSRT